MESQINSLETRIEKMQERFNKVRAAHISVRQEFKDPALSTRSRTVLTSTVH